MEFIKKNSWVFFGLFAVSFFAPLIVNTIAMVLCIGVSFFLIDWKNLLSKLFKDPFVLACLSFFIWTLLSVLWSDDKSTGINDVVSKLSLLLIPVFLGTLRFTEETSKKVIWAFILGCLGILLISISISVSDILGNPDGFASYLDAFTYEYPALNVNFQAIYLSLYVSVAFFFVLRFGMNDGFNWKNVSLLLFFFVSLIMLSSRMEIMVTLVVLLGILVQWGHSVGKLWRFTFIGASVGLVAVALILSSPINRKRFNEMLNPPAEYSDTQYGGTRLRLEKWANTIQCWKNYPVIGTGVGDYKKELDATYLSNNFMIAYEAHYNSHNQYLQSLLATGVIGLALLLCVFITAIYRAIRQKNWRGLVFIVVLALSCITESMIERQRGVVFFIFFATFLLNRKEGDS